MITIEFDQLADKMEAAKRMACFRSSVTRVLRSGEEGISVYDVTQSSLCYKSFMPKIIEQWLLFKYVDGEFTPLSKPFKTRAAAEKARSKYSEWERRIIGVGVIGPRNRHPNVRSGPCRASRYLLPRYF